MLLLHVRPRQLAASIKVAVYSGVLEDEEAILARISRQGAVFAVRQTQAGLEQFAADLLATGCDEMDDGLNTCKLALPLQRTSYSEWDSVHLHLLPPGAVQGRAHKGQLSPQWLPIRMPSIFPPDTAPAAAEVRNRATAYAHKQTALKRQLELHKREQAAIAAGVPAASAEPPQPDSEIKFERKWWALRDESMAELQAALLAMLRQALRYRGTLEFPLEAPPLEAAAAGAADHP